MTFHEGEKAVQERVGVRAMAERIGSSIHTQMPIVAQQWLRAQQLAAATTVAPDEKVWVSLLTGEAGFLEPQDEVTLCVRSPSVEHFLQTNILANDAIGLIVLEPSTRKRMRLNGSAHLERDTIVIKARQVYSNCPKYIQERHLLESSRESSGATKSGTMLQEQQRQLILGADTFFIGSHYNGNADASHRGGNPA